NQVFMNLLKNAAEAIEGAGKITIRSFATNGTVHVQMEDTGVGLAPEQIQRIFDPGIKRKGTRVRAGWGLFASYKIVEKHNGEIKIQSEPGRGTTVTVALPTT
ncbi:MAG: GHKL domain-containing protein, partial [Candidatus Krumholzibacteria bacterium]|nr:GHKL domain-containing protein [Candidatus Krumholzibacteria bacterium]